MRRIRLISRLVIAFVCAGVLIAAAAQSAAAACEHWQRRYYDNYFKSIFTCQSRGYAITDSGSSSYIYGARSFVCYQQARQKKYTMDIYFSYPDGTHCAGGGGGGGGTGSWRKPTDVNGEEPAVSVAA